MKIVIYNNIKLGKDTVWLTQSQMSNLFGVDRTVIVRHIRNIHKSAELCEDQPVQKIHKFKKNLLPKTIALVMETNVLQQQLPSDKNNSIRKFTVWIVYWHKTNKTFIYSPNTHAIRNPIRGY